MKQTPKLGAALRKRRKQLDLTLSAVCEKSGVSVGYLSQVERDNATPALGTLAQIADALGVGLEYFISTPTPSQGLTRASDRRVFAVNDSSLQYEALGTNFPGSEMSGYILHVPPGYVSETWSHEGEEMLYIIDGEIEQQLGGEKFRMRTGDSLHYSGETEHAWANPTDQTARILWAGTLTVLYNQKGAAELPASLPK